MTNWIDHVGYECPVPGDWMVGVDLGDGLVLSGDPARSWDWGPGKGPDNEGRIQRYYVMSGEVAPAITAADVLAAAAATITSRIPEYDQPQGERSMGSTVAAFNAITGHTLLESEGWLLMELLKAVRDYSKPGGHEDSQVDRTAYAALAAEARRAGR